MHRDDPQYVDNIEYETEHNRDAMRVLYQEQPAQGGRMQVTVQSVEREVPWETHQHVTQFIRVESGYGILYVGDRSFALGPGEAAVIRSGTRHRIENTGGIRPLKLYSVYTKDSSDTDWVH